MYQQYSSPLPQVCTLKYRTHRIPICTTVSVVCVCVYCLYPIMECLIFDSVNPLTSRSTVYSSLLTTTCSLIGPDPHIDLGQSTGVPYVERQNRQPAGLLSMQQQKRRADALLRRRLDFTLGSQLLCRLHGLRVPHFHHRRRRRRPHPPTCGLRRRYRRCRKFFSFSVVLPASFLDVGTTLARPRTDSNRAILHGVTWSG